MTNISSEIYFFIHSIVCGLLTGTLYDIFKVKRMVFKTSKIIVIIDDVLFWLIMGIFSILVTHNVYMGELRLYLLLGLILGITFYILLLSKKMVNYGVKLITFIFKPFKFIFKNFKFIFKFLSKIKRKCDIVCKIIINKIIYHS